jgi:hypothetical protein
MTAGKASALVAGFIGSFALGVAIGPSITDRMSDRPQTHAVAIERSAHPVERTTPSARTARRSAHRAPSEKARAATTVPATEPRLQDRLKPVLNRGAKMEIAAAGFSSGEQFATVAHAARNTSVPFMVLKHHVLDEGRSLADAIHQYKPELNARAEVARARVAARSDLAGISS